MATIDHSGTAHPEPVSDTAVTLNSRHALRNQYSNAGANMPRIDASLDQIKAAFGEPDVAPHIDWVIDTPDGRALLTLGGPMVYWSNQHPVKTHGSWLVIGGGPEVMTWILRALNLAA
jgi:hypothetical protein